MTTTPITSLLRVLRLLRLTSFRRLSGCCDREPSHVVH